MWAINFYKSVFKIFCCTWTVGCQNSFRTYVWSKVDSWFCGAVYYKNRSLLTLWSSNSQQHGQSEASHKIGGHDALPLRPASKNTRYEPFATKKKEKIHVRIIEKEPDSRPLFHDSGKIFNVFIHPFMRPCLWSIGGGHAVLPLQKRGR